MRILVTGIDSDGRSCVITDAKPSFSSVGPGFDIANVYATTTSPPPARPPGRADTIDMALAPGLMRWDLIQYGPGATAPVHHTDTYDFAFLVTGSLELILDDGAHPLAPGDCVVMTGTDHGWKAGPEGARLSVLVVGTPAPA